MHDVSVVVDKRHRQSDNLSNETKAGPGTGRMKPDAHCIRLACLPQLLVQLLIVHFDGGHRQCGVVVDVAVIQGQLNCLI